jgi:hypothetical protein
MHYIRMYNSTSFNAWDRKSDEEIARAELFSEVFKEGPQRDSNPSLYQVEAREEEIRTVTAYTLVHTNKKPEILYAIRLYEADLQALGIQADDPPGTTGVVDVDFRHYQLRQPSNQQLIALVRRIRQTAIQGEERYRWVGATHQIPCLRRFLTMSSREVIEEAKRRCRMKLGEPAGGPLRNRTQLRNELQAVPPSIPHNRIGRAAFLNFIRRCLQGQAGTREGDWEQAETELRVCYENAAW